MKRIALLVVAISAILCGCAHVPETIISYDPKRKAVVIASPKDVEITSATITVSNNVVSIHFTGYKARNNIEVIRAVAARNAELLENAVKLTGAGLGELLEHAK